MTFTGKWSFKIIRSVQTYFWEIWVKLNPQHNWLTVMTHEKILTYKHVWQSKRPSALFVFQSNCWQMSPSVVQFGVYFIFKKWRTVDLCSGFVSFGLYMDYASCSWPVIIDNCWETWSSICQPFSVLLLTKK